MSTVGVKELQEAAVALAKLSVAVAECIKTGKFDMLAFMPVIIALPEAIKDAGQIPEELKDIDSAEFQQVCDAVLNELKPLNLPIDLIKLYTAAAVKFLDATLALVKAIQAS